MEELGVRVAPTGHAKKKYLEDIGVRVAPTVHCIKDIFWRDWSQGCLN
jgi:hypothetical protein